jgi:hypothetical protein
MRINRKLPSGYDGCYTAHKTSPGNISATPQNARDYRALGTQDYL